MAGSGMWKLEGGSRKVEAGRWKLEAFVVVRYNKINFVYSVLTFYASNYFSNMRFLISK